MTELKESNRITIFILFLIAFVGVAPTEAGALGYKSASVKKEGKSYVVDINYPQITDEKISEDKKQKANQAISDFVRTLYADDLKSFETPVEDYPPEGVFGADTIDVSFKVIYAGNDRISIRFEKYFYGIGAAHGFREIYGFNYDIKNSKSIQLVDLFKQGTDYLKQISDYCIIDLNRRLKPEVNDSDGGAGPKEDNLKEFGLTKKYLIIYFSDYQVACYASGTQEVKIPVKKLEGFLGSDNMR